MDLFTAASKDDVANILESGFPDNIDLHMTDYNRIFTLRLKGSNNVLLCVSLECSEDEIRRWEQVEDNMTLRRGLLAQNGHEWLIPASFVNAHTIERKEMPFRELERYIQEHRNPQQYSQKSGCNATWVALMTFLGIWIYCTIFYGFLGFALAPIPAAIIALVAGALCARDH